MRNSKKAVISTKKVAKVSQKINKEPEPKMSPLLKQRKSTKEPGTEKKPVETARKRSIKPNNRTAVKENVQIFSGENSLDFLDKITQSSWSAYRASPLKNLVLATSTDEDNFLNQQAELLRPSLKLLRAYLESETPSLILPIRLLKSSDSSTFLLHDSVLEPKAVRGWVAAIPASTSNQALGMIGIDIDLRMRSSSMENSENCRLTKYTSSNGDTSRNPSGASFQDTRIHIVIMTGMGGETEPSLVLAKGNSTAVELGIRWLKMFCDARVCQFWMAPHHLQNILAISLSIIIRHHSEGSSSKSLITRPSAELKFQFPRELFPRKELDFLVVNLPWKSVLSVWNAMLPNPPDPASDLFISHCESLIEGLDEVFLKLCGISLKKMSLKQLGTPLVVAQCYGKLKFFAGYPKESYIQLINLIISLSR